MPTAIVTGATGESNDFDLGITGTAVVDALIKAPEYTEIYTLSRSQKYSEHPKVKHATLDLQSSAEDMSKSLSHIPPVTHIYFCAYLANPDEGEAVTRSCIRAWNGFKLLIIF
ncbi:hypothetical protein F4814DRAFT_420542 [Daldinia grandis]|nr:hypothetical protein F4814DRAFT_420542 [Daldinia grandis]